MEKQEFLDKLRLALTGKVATEVVNDTINYYEEYINGEVRMGQDMEDVMSSLGDPRLIARTIVETKGGQSASARSTYGEQGNGSSEVRKPHIQMPGWVWLIVILAIIIFVLSMVFKILVIFSPFILVLVVVIFLVKLFRDWLN